MSVRQTIKATTLAWLIALIGWYGYFFVWQPYQQHLDVIESAKTFSDPKLLPYTELSYIYSAQWNEMKEEPGPSVLGFVILPLLAYALMLISALALRSGVSLVRAMRT